MRALWLDYQRTPPGRQRPGVLLLIAGVIVTGLVLTQYWQYRNELGAGQQHLAGLKRESARRQSLATGNERTADAARSQQRLLSVSAARWESLFSALEGAGDESVTLLGLAPGAKDITINGEAKDLDAAMDYVKRLQSASALANAHLSEYAVDKENPQHPVKFSVAAEWREAA